MAPLESDPVADYLELGLRLGRHLDGMVDAYYGPPELEQRVADEPRVELPALVEHAREQLRKLDDGAGDLEANRRHWLKAQVQGLRTSARKLDGEEIPFADEVEQCYGVVPERVSEDVLAEAHRNLDQVLPGSGSLLDRFEAWRVSHQMTPEQLTTAIHALAENFRERTNELFGLPDGEHIEFELVTNEPWSGFNYYEGNLQSRVAINIDMPVSSTAISHLIAHEAYPGHHTEHARKEVGLVRARQHLEESIFLVGTPQCLMAEGLADLALEALLGEKNEPIVAGILRPLHIRYDTEVVAAVSIAAAALSAVRGNVAIMLNSEGATNDEAVAYLERWALLSHNRATKSIGFLTHPTWRAYIFCYVAGLPLCRSFVAGDHQRFQRLLDEQWTPDQLTAA